MEALGQGGSRGLRRAEEDDGAAAEEGERGPGRVPDGGRRGGSARGEERTQILLRWSRGSQDPDEAAQRLCHLHADGGDGVLQEQVEGCEEQSRDMPGAAGARPLTPAPGWDRAGGEATAWLSSRAQKGEIPLPPWGSPPAPSPAHTSPGRQRHPKTSWDSPPRSPQR